MRTEGGTLYDRSQLRDWINSWGDCYGLLGSEELVDLEAALNHIDSEERRVVVGLMSGYSLREVSRIMELGRSATPARRLFEKALIHLEEVLNGKDATRAPRPAQERQEHAG